MSKRNPGKRLSVPSEILAKRPRQAAPEPEESESPGAGRSKSAQSERSVKVQEASYNDMKPYFMAVAHLYAKFSTDPHTKVGACIVNKDNHIVGVGYNKMPEGWEEGDEKDDVRHAEDDAIRSKTTDSLKGCRMFVTLYPCDKCAPLIGRNRISEVIYMRRRYTKKYRNAEDILDSAAIESRASPCRQSAAATGTSCRRHQT